MFFFFNLVQHSLTVRLCIKKKKTHIEAIKSGIKFAPIVCSDFDSRFIAVVLKNLHKSSRPTEAVNPGHGSGLPLQHFCRVNR